MNHPFIFLDRGNKAKLVPDSLSYFLENLNLKSEIVITVIKKLIKLSYLHCSCKKVVENSN